MTLTPEQEAEGRRFRASIMRAAVGTERYNCDLCGDVVTPDNLSGWDDDAHVYCTGHGRPLASPCSEKAAYRIIEAHGADAEPARPTRAVTNPPGRIWLSWHERDYCWAGWHDNPEHAEDGEQEYVRVASQTARPTPWPRDYSELVWDADGWSQTIIVDGKRPEWLRDDDAVCGFGDGVVRWSVKDFGPHELAIRVRRREPKRETVECAVIPAWDLNSFSPVHCTIDLIDGEPDLSTLKLAEGAL